MEDIKNKEEMNDFWKEEANSVEDASDAWEEEVRPEIEKTLQRIQSQNMILGFRVAIKTVLDKITVFEHSPGKHSTNDYKRLIKDIKQFCETGLSRKMDQNGEIEPVVEETIQN